MEQEINEILKYLIDEDLIQYKCFDILKQKLIEDSSFREKIIFGIKEGMIARFPRELFDKVCDQNIRAPFKPVQIFIDGANIGNCTLIAKMVSYSLNSCDICGGTVGILEGTKNSPDGRHTWISYKGTVIDTSLMIQINEHYIKELGYIEKNRYNPCQNPLYNAAKEYANDKSIKRSK